MRRNGRAKSTETKGGALGRNERRSPGGACPKDAQDQVRSGQTVRCFEADVDYPERPAQRGRGESR